MLLNLSFRNTHDENGHSQSYNVQADDVSLSTQCAAGYYYLLHALVKF